MDREVTARLKVENEGDSGAFARLASEIDAVGEAFQGVEPVIDQVVEGIRERFASLKGISAPLIAELEAVLAKLREAAAAVDELAE